ncbi:MAG: DUF1631 family protein [Pseudomonadota bacterium]
MKPSLSHRLPAPLEAGIQALKMAARAAVERTVESLGLAALSAGSVHERDRLLGAQFELNRRSAVFALVYNEALDEQVQRELGSPAGLATAQGGTNWDTLSLVEDQEVEVRVAAERFGLEVSGNCEWELRELGGYIGSLVETPAGERERNPLRPEIVGHAMVRGISAVCDRPDVRQVLAAELGRSLGGLLPTTYSGIVASLRNAGVRPLSLSVRQRNSRSGAGVGHTDVDTLGRPLDGPSFGPSGRGSPHALGPAPASAGGAGPAVSASGASAANGIDPTLMALMRRMAQLGHLGPLGPLGASGSGGSGHGDLGTGVPGPLPNLIREHRDELRQASRGALDHLVIDVIGTLFDQILADPKLPPQMAGLIARLQMPVLHAALGDPAFFASRRHPVRRFVNRIASLGAAYDDFGSPAARQFLAKVRARVQEVVEGDFDQIQAYERKLRVLEEFAAEQARAEVADPSGNPAADPASLLAQKEDQLRLHALYARQLAGDLKSVAAPEFVREFISQVWSQVLLRAAEVGGADGELVGRLRRTGRTLYLSVLPKPTPEHRKAFLAELPGLMQDLTEGMNLIAVPEDARRAFFGRLLPAHAEALKAAAARQLDVNLAARQVEGALDKALPSRADLMPGVGLAAAAAEEVPPPRFTPEEAERVGLLQEEAIDWKAPVEIDLDRLHEEAELAQAAAARNEAAAAGSAAVLPFPAVEPAPAGRDLVAEAQVGFSYRMHLAGEWHKVRLAHVSAARTFFVFTYGDRNRRTVSLTQRMLGRLSDSGRFRAFESADLLERATARARSQLAALGTAA